jgi:hypothetical protein
MLIPCPLHAVFESEFATAECTTAVAGPEVRGTNPVICQIFRCSLFHQFTVSSDFLAASRHYVVSDSEIP